MEKTKDVSMNELNKPHIDDDDDDDYDHDSIKVTKKRSDIIVYDYKVPTVDNNHVMLDG